MVHASADLLGMILMGGGLGWALIGVYCGIHPASSPARYRLRSHLGVFLLILTSALVTVWVFTAWQLPYHQLWTVGVWTVAGIGMGLTYLDTMNVFFEDPDEDDGISMPEMASAAVIVESLSSTMFIPLTASIVSLAFTGDGSSTTWPYGLAWLVVMLLFIPTLGYLHRAQPAAANQN